MRLGGVVELEADEELSKASSADPERATGWVGYVPGRWVCGAGDLYLTDRRFVYVPAGLGGGVVIGGRHHLMKQLVDIPLSEITAVETTRRFPLLWLVLPIMGRAARGAALFRYVLGPLYGLVTHRLLVRTTGRDFIFDVGGRSDWAAAIFAAANRSRRQA